MTGRRPAAGWTAREHQELLTAAGFVDVAIHQERGEGGICGVAQKPIELAG